jgi:hypothetical protein
MRALAHILAAALLAGAPFVVAAQRGGDPSFEGPRGAFSFQLSDGEPISFFLEWSRVLELSDAQREKMMDIRRHLRLQNAAYVKQLDSLRELAGIDMMERGRLTQKDREAFERFARWSKPVADSIRVNNDAARAEAMALLAETQRVRVDSIVVAVRERGDRGRGRPRPPSSDSEQPIHPSRRAVGRA